MPIALPYWAHPGRLFRTPRHPHPFDARELQLLPLGGLEVYSREGPPAYLRPYDMRDLDTFVELEQDPSVLRFVNWRPELAVRHLAVRTQHTILARPDDFLALGLIHGAYGNVIGDLSMHLRRHAIRIWSGEIGWIIAEPFRGMGLAVGAADALMTYAMGRLGLAFVDARIDPENAASIATARRLGMAAHHDTEQHIVFRRYRKALTA